MSDGRGFREFIGFKSDGDGVAWRKLLWVFPAAGIMVREFKVVIHGKRGLVQQLYNTAARL